MNYTLHKLPEGFLVTSDEKIEEGNIGFDGLYIFKCLKPFIANETTSGKNIPCFYIELGETSVFHETSYIKKVIAQQDQIDFSALSEEKQKEIGWFDIDKIAYKFCDEITPKDVTRSLHYPFKRGFQKAQELLFDRRFTLEDMKKAFNAGDNYRYYENGGFLFIPSDVLDEDQYIQSLSQPKSWKVELEMEYDLESIDSSKKVIKPKLTNGKIKILKLL